MSRYCTDDMAVWSDTRARSTEPQARAPVSSCSSPRTSVQWRSGCWLLSSFNAAETTGTKSSREVATLTWVPAPGCSSLFCGAASQSSSFDIRTYPQTKIAAKPPNSTRTSTPIPPLEQNRITSLYTEAFLKIPLSTHD